MVRKTSCILIVLTALLGLSCEKEKNTYFLIESDQVGLLSRTTTMVEVETLYAADSLVSDTVQFAMGAGNSKIKIFEKGGKQLLTLTSNTDSVPKIGHILISDARFKTSKGIGLQSTFEDIEKNHNISKIVTSMNNIVVLLEDSDIYFTIDKKELPAHLRYTKTRPIEKVEIPGQAGIKYLMVGWQ